MNTEYEIERRVWAWERARETGTPVTPADLCGDRPDLLPEVERRVAAVAAEGDGTPGRGRTTGPYQEVAGPAGDPDGMDATAGYRVVGPLGAGGMGVVYRAEDLTLGREVAVKTVHPRLAGNPEAAARFAREAHVTARLTHPAVPQVHALGTLPDGRPFLAMKLVRGQTLADLLAARPDPAADLPRFVGVFEQICQAVGYAHSRGVVHRDLKPANVMVGAFGEVQVMDWGLALGKDEGGRMKDGGNTDAGPGLSSSFILPPSTFPKPLPPSHVTAAGVARGTPAFMAPEQARGEAVDARADVYALGAVLCAVLTGRPPFAGATADEVLRRAAAGDLVQDQVTGREGSRRVLP